MGSQLVKFVQQEDINEYLLVITTIMADLIKDVENIIDFLTHTASGLVTRLLLLEKIIAELREAVTQLAKGLHFPFKVQIENCQTIQKYTTINAYYDRSELWQESRRQLSPHLAGGRFASALTKILLA